MENSLLRKEKVIKYYFECGAEMEQFFLPLYNYENKVCKNVRLVIMKVLSYLSY